MLLKLCSTIPIMSAGIKAGLNPLMAHLPVVDMETSKDNKQTPGRNKQ